MIYLFIGLIILLVCFLYSSCIVSSRYSRIEEKLELEEYYGK